MAVDTYCLLMLLSLNFITLRAQITPNVSLNSGITAGTNDSWLSPSGEFAFGFYQLPGNLYLLGIWLNKIPERTLLWSANRDSPAQPGSIVRLTSSGQFLLTYLNGGVQTLYDGAAAPASFGVMQDDGNFVLKDGGSRNSLWQSFGSPTDTLLPGQVLRTGQKLFSNLHGTNDYSTGDFMLEMQSDGNLVLSAYRFADPGYWYTETVKISNVTLVFDSDASLYLVNSTNGEIHSLRSNFSGSVGEYYHRALINDRGNFHQFVYHKSNGSGWRSVWQPFHDPCTVNAICGVNGMCLSPDNETMTCKCIPGHIPLDPNDVTKGCHPKTMMNYCADPAMRNFTIEVVDDADFPPEGFADLDRVHNVDVEGCKQSLMNDCYSLAASLVDSKCIKKRSPLLNARKCYTTKGRTAFVKVPVNMSNPKDSGSSKDNDFDVRTFLEISLVASAILAFFFGITAFIYHPATRKFIRRNNSSSASTIGINFREFKYQELHEATDGFSKTLGRGSSARVYSGVLQICEHAQIDIAVKGLTKETERSHEEFLTELKIIARTHHKNLVRLLGFCVENNQWLLVYELMTNGTLSNLLFGKREKPSWDLSAEMVLGIARGLLYLHEECETQIIHCDIKPENVLLDANYKAKISDFGLSKLLNKEQTRTDTNMRGTVGYLAPEWLRNAPVTSKVDVYSFGVMLLEILSCRRHIESNRVEEESEEEDLVLSDWVMSCMISGKLDIVAGLDPEVMSDFKRFESMALVGIWCIHPEAVLRPSMKKVNQMLEGVVEVRIPPLLSELTSNAI